MLKPDDAGGEQQHTTGVRSYELSDHLGNVHIVVSDLRIGLNQVKVLSATEYYPFGMGMPGRTYATSSGYRHNFNGKELDQETGVQDYGFRIYNPNIAKFLSVDPLTSSYPMLTPYQFASNSPIAGIDIDGLEFGWAQDLWDMTKEGYTTTIKKVDEYYTGTVNYVKNTKVEFNTSSSVGIQAGLKTSLYKGTGTQVSKGTVKKIGVEGKINIVSVNTSSTSTSYSAKEGFKSTSKDPVKDNATVEQEISGGVNFGVVGIKAGASQKFDVGACPGCAANTGSHNNETTLSYGGNIGPVEFGREQKTQENTFENEQGQSNSNGNETVMGFSLDASIIFGVKIELKLSIPDSGN